MMYINPRLKAINQRMTRLPVIPLFEPYRNRQELYEAVQNYVENHKELWRKRIALSEKSAVSSRNHYRELREALMSLGADIGGLPRRLRIKVKEKFKIKRDEFFNKLKPKEI